MKNHFYLRLAMGNIRKNGKFYLPFLLTCVAAAAMFFNMCSILGNDTLVKSMDTQYLLQLGVVVIAIFSVIFLFYTNSFLIKRRKKELALYNIFGMEKRHIGRMLAWENVISAVISIGAGTLLGMLFDRLMFLVLIKMLRLERVAYSFSSSPVWMTMALFGGIFVLIFISDVARIQKSRPAELLRGASAGEKEPKSRILLAVFGFLCLASGYGLAVSQRGISAFEMFFIAVLLVIVGTYCLFTAGTIAVLKLVRRNKNYYYQPKHFISVSGMMYRMRQNAVGLANICILSTIVLVMLSSTVSMYAGMNNIIENRYPFDVEASYISEEGAAVQAAEEIRDTAGELGLDVKNYISYEHLSVAFLKNGSVFSKGADDSSMKDAAMIIFLTPKSYLNLTGRQTELADDEILIYNVSKAKSSARFGEGDTLDILGVKLTVKEQLGDHPVRWDSVYPIDDVYYIVLSGDEMMKEIDRLQSEAYENSRSTLLREIRFDLSGTDEQQEEFCEVIKEKKEQWQEASEASKAAGQPDASEYPIQSIGSKAGSISRFYSLYGGFLFIGVFLGILFIVATVLIIYYKQIIEGYEDKERFEIMRKVGLGRSEIKSAVKSQILTMFSLPLAVAVVHLAFAFPMVKHILSLMSLTNVSLFFVCTAAVVCIFAVCYAAVYGLTAKAYYKIVS